MKTLKIVKTQMNISYFILSIFAILLLAACGKENMPDLQPEINTDQTEYKRSHKRDVCHNGHIINVSVNAIPAHQAHGDAVDMDGDGYFDLENDCGMPVDCDDNDASVNGGAPELPCDGIDNNCDGEIDNLPNIALNKPAQASRFWTGDGGHYIPYAFDGDNNTFWNAGAWPTQWISVDLGAEYSISQMNFLPDMDPPVDNTTIHNVYFSADGINWGTPVDVIDVQTEHNVEFTRCYTNQTARYIKVETTSGVSWVAWREIEVFE